MKITQWYDRPGQERRGRVNQWRAWGRPSVWSGACVFERI